MKKFPSIIFNMTLLFSLIFAGIFCYQGIELMNHHCSGDVSSVWCSDFISHGTIISSVVLTIIFSVLFFVVAVVLIKLFFRIKTKPICLIRIRNKIPILSPMQIAFSRGILHSRIP